MSLLLYPAFLSASKQFHLSRVASLALCDTLGTLGVEVVIKWPNDILTSRGKIAGILIEHGIRAGKIVHTVIGIGLNLNQSDFPLFKTPATSLFLERGERVEIEDVARIVGLNLMGRYKALKEGHTSLLEAQYMERLFRAEETVVFRAGEEVFEGTIKGVSDFGELQVMCRGEIRTFGHGAIRMEL